MHTIRKAFLTVLAILSLSAVIVGCGLDDGQNLGGDTAGDRATMLQAVGSRETFDCVQDSNGIICTSEALDLVAWCDYETNKCGGGCLHCN